MINNLPEYKAKLAGRHILLVEDDEINQEVALDILGDVDAEVTVVDNGQLAIELIKQKQQHNDLFDIVLMDIQMPVMDGLTATKLLREENVFKDLPIIALTAHAQDKHEEECLGVGMNYFVSKPFEEENLYTSIIQCLKL